MTDLTIPAQPHHLEAERIRLDILRRQTPAQKLLALKGLQRTAIKLKRDMVRSEHPEMSEEEIKSTVRDWVLYGSV